MTTTADATRTSLDAPLTSNGRVVAITWAAVYDAALLVSQRWEGAGLTGVHGIPQGGAVPAVLVAHHLHLPVVDHTGPGVLVMDDLVDSGATMAAHVGRPHDALFRKPHSPRHLAPDAVEVDGWLAFPWERDRGEPTDAVRRLLQHVGEDPDREGLVDTPRRVVKAWGELTCGYQQDPAVILSVDFDAGPVDEMVAVVGITFTSLCEHHILPFHGTATVAYIPRERVVGLSKLARLVDVFACRLQIQERLTAQIADALVHHLDPLGVGVSIRAEHGCMAHRGAHKPGAEMVTTALRGWMKELDATRAEFLALTR